jgi:aspartyl protease family protein
MAGSASFVLVAAGLVGLATFAPTIDEVLADSGAERPAGSLAIPRAPDGQFYFEARSGGTTIRFLVDSGIEDIVLSGEDATRAGLEGAGPSRLSSLSVGTRELSQVPARVAPDLPVSLIGRSYLVRTAGAHFTRDEMLLR